MINSHCNYWRLFQLTFYTDNFASLIFKCSLKSANGRGLLVNQTFMKMGGASAALTTNLLFSFLDCPKPAT